MRLNTEVADLPVNYKRVSPQVEASNAAMVARGTS
jgi:hypothetical protein